MPPRIGEDRVEVMQRLEAAAKMLDKTLERAQRDGTPEQKQMAVRAGRRLAEAIAKKAMELTRLGEREPWVTAPTKQRVEQAGEVPIRTIVNANGDAGVNHRWEWPVAQLHKMGLVRADPTISATRLSKCFYRLGRQPATMDYNGAVTATDPTSRAPILEHQEGAWGEFAFVMKRLTPLERVWAWALVIQAPLVGEAEPPKPANLASRTFDVRTPQLARYLAYGILITTMDRIHSAYQHFDLQQRQRDPQLRAKVLEEYSKHIERVPQSRIKAPT